MGITLSCEKIHTDFEPTIHKALLNAINRKKSGKTYPNSQFRPVSPEILSGLFLKAIEDVDRHFPDGSLAYAKKHYPELYKDSNDREKTLNEIWQKCLSGENEYGDFVNALEALKSTYVLIGKAYTKVLQKEGSYVGAKGYGK